MVEAKESEARKKVLNLLELVDNGSVISKGLASNVQSVVEKARKEQEKYGLESLLNDPLIKDGDNWRPAYASEAEFRRLPAEEQQERLGAAYGARHAWAFNNAITAFATNPDDILQEKGKYDGKLLKAADGIIHTDDKRIKDIIEKDDNSLLEKYAVYSQYDKIFSMVEEGKPVPGELKEQLTKMARAGAYETAYNDWFKGYNEEARKAVSTLVSLVAADSIKEKDVLKAGAQRLKGKAEEELKRVVGKDKEWKDEVASAVGKTLSKMVKSSNPELEQKATGLYYYAQKDYSIGERDFKDVYK